ncbi:hypothetical protein DICSQDRAFT_25464, partial [Dichomitus squalens LYAD-421 SS1]
KAVLSFLTKNYVKIEAEGYLKETNADLSRALLAAVLSRKARTSLKLVKREDGHSGHAQAKQLAMLGAKKPTPDEINLNVPVKWRVSEAKLSVMMQSLAYQEIKKRRLAGLKRRERTETNLMLIREGIKDAFDYEVTDEMIWKSIRSKHVTGITSQFLWKTIHDIFMIGDKWRRDDMPEEYQDRAVCPICENTESMDHILFRCEAVGQAEVWAELKKVW